MNARGQLLREARVLEDEVPAQDDDKIVGLRRNLVLEDSRFPQELTGAFRAMENQGNPWGQPASARLDWAKPLEFEVETVAAVAAAGRLDELEVLYWVGCAAAFDPRNQKVARAVATCLHAAGVRFAVLGQEESCTGDPARRMGNDYVFQILASGNVATLDRYGMGERTIVTACPHCFNTIGNEYGQLGGDYRIVHHSTYLAELLASGRLQTVPEDAAASSGEHRPGSVTVHDSCYLARYNGVVAAPRDVLGAAGVSVTEMEKSGRNTFCCGAGGGRMWMEEDRGTRINAERTRQVLETGAETVATACPFCMVMLSDGIAASAGRAPWRRWTSARSWPRGSRPRPRTAGCPCSEVSRRRDQPGRCFPQFEQIASVTRLPVLHSGQRFMPSVLVAYRLSCGPAACIRCRRSIASVATAPTAAAAISMIRPVVSSIVVPDPARNPIPTLAGERKPGSPRRQPA